MRRPRTLITDAGTPATLAVARSLHRAGHRVTVVASSRHDAAAASHAVSDVVLAPDPFADAGGFREVVAKALRRRRFDLFVPVADGALLLAGDLRDAIPAHTVCALPDPARLAFLQDKVAVLSRAEALGIPVLPRRGPGEVAGAPLPAVVKPGRSRVLSRGRILAATARVAGSDAAVAAEVDRLVRAGHGAFVEPWIPGEGRGIFLLRHRGEVLARFAHRRIREASPLGGPSAVAESVEPDPELLAYAEALADDLGADGPFMAEFRGEPGDFVLLEVNARYWGSLALALAAGVDFPALHAAALLGSPARGPDRWRVGLRVRTLPLELRGLFETLRGPPPDAEYPWPSRSAAVVDAAFERAGGVFRDRDDPGPARAVFLSLLDRIFRHVE